MIDKELQKKIDAAIKLLQSVAKRTEGALEIAYSGGKDSDVILQLAKEAGIEYRAIYKNTTIDPPGTIKHALDMGAEMIRPKETFFHLIERAGMPTRFTRFCCAYLKEYKVGEKSVIGVRKSESRARANRYNEPTACRWYGSHKPENHVEQIFPILEWTDDDVLQFILDREITLAPVYYDENGEIDIKRRLGCMCCPLASEKKRRAQFAERPKMVRAYYRAARKYLANKPDGKVAQRYQGDAYEWLYREINYPREDKWQEVRESVQGRCKELLEEQFGVSLTL